MKGLIAYQNDNDYLKMKTYEHQQTLKEETLSKFKHSPWKHSKTDDKTTLAFLKGSYLFGRGPLALGNAN